MLYDFMIPIKITVDSKNVFWYNVEYIIFLFIFVSSLYFVEICVTMSALEYLFKLNVNGIV